MKGPRTKETDAALTPESIMPPPAPHFDDLAVAIAQPVEPIAEKRSRDWLAVLERPKMIVAILIVAALLGTTGLALTVRFQQEPDAEQFATTNPIEETAERPDETAEQPVLSNLEEQLHLGSQSKKKKKARRVHHSKREARRVGVIIYR